jgi:PII-like signaling protein
MHGFKGQRVLMRISVEEQDRYQHRPLHEAILRLLLQRRYAGATVLRGRLGFGPSGRVHRERAVSLTEDVPIVIEVVDTEERIQAILPELDRMVGGGLITLERVRVILYRTNVTPEARTEHEQIEVTGSWRVLPTPPER